MATKNLSLDLQKYLPRLTINQVLELDNAFLDACLCYEFETSWRLIFTKLKHKYLLGHTHQLYTFLEGLTADDLERISARLVKSREE